MRTTLDIADDMLYLIKDYARRDKKTLGATVSDMLREAVRAPVASARSQHKETKDSLETDKQRRLREIGWVTLPSSRAGGGIVTNEMINRIREEEGI
jgi:hypothetical protein